MNTENKYLKNYYYDHPETWLYLSDSEFLEAAELNIPRYIYYLKFITEEELTDKLEVFRGNKPQKQSLNAWLNNYLPKEFTYNNIFLDTNVASAKEIKPLYLDFLFFNLRLNYSLNYIKSFLERQKVSSKAEFYDNKANPMQNLVEKAFSIIMGNYTGANISSQKQKLVRQLISTLEDKFIDYMANDAKMKPGVIDIYYDWLKYLFMQRQEMLRVLTPQNVKKESIDVKMTIISIALHFIYRITGIQKHIKENIRKTQMDNGNMPSNVIYNEIFKSEHHYEDAMEIRHLLSEKRRIKIITSVENILKFNIYKGGDKYDYDSFKYGEPLLIMTYSYSTQKYIQKVTWEISRYVDGFAIELERFQENLMTLRNTFYQLYYMAGEFFLYNDILQNRPNLYRFLKEIKVFHSHNIEKTFIYLRVDNSNYTEIIRFIETLTTVLHVNYYTPLINEKENLQNNKTYQFHKNTHPEKLITYNILKILEKSATLSNYTKKYPFIVYCIVRVLILDFQDFIANDRQFNINYIENILNNKITNLGFVKEQDLVLEKIPLDVVSIIDDLISREYPFMQNKYYEDIFSFFYKKFPTAVEKDIITKQYSIFYHYGYRHLRSEMSQIKQEFDGIFLDLSQENDYILKDHVPIKNLLYELQNNFLEKPTEEKLKILRNTGVIVDYNYKASTPFLVLGPVINIYFSHREMSKRFISVFTEIEQRAIKDTILSRKYYLATGNPEFAEDVPLKNVKSSRILLVIDSPFLENEVHIFGCVDYQDQLGTQECYAPGNNTLSIDFPLKLIKELNEQHRLTFDFIKTSYYSRKKSYLRFLKHIITVPKNRILPFRNSLNDKIFRHTIGGYTAVPPYDAYETGEEPLDAKNRSYRIKGSSMKLYIEEHFAEYMREYTEFTYTNILSYNFEHLRDIAIDVCNGALTFADAFINNYNGENLRKSFNLWNEENINNALAILKNYRNNEGLHKPDLTLLDKIFLCQLSLEKTQSYTWYIDILPINLEHLRNLIELKVHPHCNNFHLLSNAMIHFFLNYFAKGEWPLDTWEAIKFMLYRMEEENKKNIIFHIETLNFTQNPAVISDIIGDDIKSTFSNIYGPSDTEIISFDNKQKKNQGIIVRKKMDRVTLSIAKAREELKLKEPARNLSMENDLPDNSQINLVIEFPLNYHAKKYLPKLYHRKNTNCEYAEQLVWAAAQVYDNSTVSKGYVYLEHSLKDNINFINYIFDYESDFIITLMNYHTELFLNICNNNRLFRDTFFFAGKGNTAKIMLHISAEMLDNMFQHDKELEDRLLKHLELTFHYFLEKQPTHVKVFVNNVRKTKNVAHDQLQNIILDYNDSTSNSEPMLSRLPDIKRRFAEWVKNNISNAESIARYLESHEVVLEQQHQRMEDIVNTLRWDLVADPYKYSDNVFSAFTKYYFDILNYLARELLLLALERFDNPFAEALLAFDLETNYENKTYTKITPDPKMSSSENVEYIKNLILDNALTKMSQWFDMNKHTLEGHLSKKDYIRDKFKLNLEPVVAQEILSQEHGMIKDIIDILRRDKTSEMDKYPDSMFSSFLEYYYNTQISQKAREIMRFALKIFDSSFMQAVSRFKPRKYTDSIREEFTAYLRYQALNEMNNWIFLHSHRIDTLLQEYKFNTHLKPFYDILGPKTAMQKTFGKRPKSARSLTPMEIFRHSFQNTLLQNIMENSFPEDDKPTFYKFMEYYYHKQKRDKRKVICLLCSIYPKLFMEKLLLFKNVKATDIGQIVSDIDHWVFIHSHSWVDPNYQGHKNHIDQKFQQMKSALLRMKKSMTLTKQDPKTLQKKNVNISPRKKV